MKYILEGTSIEAIGTFVRITMGNGKAQVTKKECPSAIDVACMLQEMQGYTPNNAQRQACSRAAHDAINNKTELFI